MESPFLIPRTLATHDSLEEGSVRSPWQIPDEIRKECGVPLRLVRVTSLTTVHDRPEVQKLCGRDWGFCLGKKRI